MPTILRKLLTNVDGEAAHVSVLFFVQGFVCVVFGFVLDECEAILKQGNTMQVRKSGQQQLAAREAHHLRPIAHASSINGQMVGSGIKAVGTLEFMALRFKSHGGSNFDGSFLQQISATSSFSRRFIDLVSKFIGGYDWSFFHCSFLA